MEETAINHPEDQDKGGPTRLSDSKRAVLEKLLRGQAAKAGAQQTPIGRRPPGKPIPLSFQQLQVWLHGQASTISFYNETFTITRRGPLDVEVLSRCFLEIVRRHEILRTTFSTQAGEPVQVVQPPPAAFPLGVVDLRSLTGTPIDSEAKRLAIQDARRPFDAATGPLFRVLLVRTDEEEYQLYMAFHQIIFDGTTGYRILVPELLALYEAFLAGKTSPLPEPSLQYGDFAYWQRQTLPAEESEKQLLYWQDRLQGEIAPLAWPNDHPRPALETHRGAIQRLTFREDLIAQLKSFCQRENASPYMALLAAFGALLSRYTGQEDIVLGGLSAGRQKFELEKLMGYFINPLALRFCLEGNPSFRELLARVRDTLLDALTHQDVPFLQLVRQLHRKPDASRNPVFQIILSQQPQLPALPPGWDVVIEEASNGGSKLDLMIILEERDASYAASITYNPDLFNASTLVRMVEHWQALLENAIARPETRVQDLVLLTDKERRALLIDWNQTQQDYPRACVHQLFEEQAKRNPNAVAAVFGDQHLTYADLNRRANSLAHYLRTRGVDPDASVAVCVERSLEMITCLLGVMKAGGAYIPLDPIYPKERIGFILEDAKPRVVLTQVKLLDQLPPCSGEIVRIDADWKQISSENEQNPEPLSKPENLAYVIYTSGSTGRPKGVQVEHRNVVNFLSSMQRKPGLDRNDVLLAVTTISFDIAGLEMYLPLITGAKLVIAGADAIYEGHLLLKLLAKNQATVMQATPSTWRMLIEAGWTGDDNLKVLCGGEAFPSDLARALVERSQSVWNLYGPTETTIWSSVYRVQGRISSTIPIGRPIANTRLYILDKQLQPVPIGVPGELYIGGHGVARGYFNRPELTAEQFIPDPFSSQPGARLYWTGDLSKVLPTGDVEFLGRPDFQVKMRGLRIELGEIEAVLGEHSGVRESAVTAWEDRPGNKLLVAYLTVDPKQAPENEELRRFLGRKLPSYMVPSAFEFLESMPRTPNGKIDRKALPAPKSLERKHESAALRPRDDIETRLASIWEEVLGTKQVGVRDDFFELGGHSLLVAKLAARIEQDFGRKLSFASVFEAPTLEQMAGLLRNRASESQRLTQLIPIQPEGSLPPFFFVCIEEGPIFRTLAQHLGGNRPFLGLDVHPSIVDHLPAPYRLEDLAAHLVREIREKQPEGPYFIGGHCLRALIAYEVARQLEEQGQEVALLVMLQARNPAPSRHFSNLSQLTSLGRRLKLDDIRRHLRNLRELGMRQAPDYITSRVVLFARDFWVILWQVYILLRMRLAGGKLKDLRQILIMAAKAYKPHPFAGRVALIWHTQRRDEGDADPQSGWGDVASGPISVQHVGGAYWGIYQEPAVRVLAERLSESIQEAGLPAMAPAEAR